MEKQTDENFYNTLICPIICEMMVNPVVAADGHTYERSAIEEWLKKRDTSPMTGEKMKSKVLVDNFQLRSIINLYKENPFFFKSKNLEDNPQKNTDKSMIELEREFRLKCDYKTSYELLEKLYQEEKNIFSLFFLYFYKSGVIGGNVAIPKPNKTELEEMKNILKEYKFYLKQESSKGNIDSLYILSILYFNGILFTEDLVKSYDLAKKGSEKNDPNCLCLLAQIFYKREDYKNAREYFMKAYEMGSYRALIILSYSYLNGNGVPKSEKKFIENMEIATANQCPLAYYELAQYYENEKSSRKDTELCFSYYKKSAEEGIILAYNKLGQMYENGIGIPKNFEMAFQFYQKSAETGSKEGLTNLGFCYKLGIGVLKDENKANNLFEQADKLGRDDLIYNLLGNDRGRKTWYFVLIERANLRNFLRDMKNDSTNLELYGKIIESGYGETPPEDIVKSIKKKYLCEIDEEEERQQKGRKPTVTDINQQKMDHKNTRELNERIKEYLSDTKKRERDPIRGRKESSCNCSIY